MTRSGWQRPAPSRGVQRATNALTVTVVLVFLALLGLIGWAVVELVLAVVHFLAK